MAIETIISESQFFYILLTVIWLYVSTLAYESDDTILLYIQFFICLPLAIMLFADSFFTSSLFGVGVGFAVLCASIYFVFLGTALAKK